MHSSSPAPDEEVEVLVIGGSLVGLSTAMFLGIHGIRALAVERHASTAIHPRAGHFQLRTSEVLRSAGLEERVRQPLGGAVPPQRRDQQRRVARRP